MKMNGATEDVIKMHLFPFSLRDKARGWLQSLLPGSINTQEELAQRFLSKFFPPSKTSQLRGEIAQFRQMDFKPLYKAWECFKDFLRHCPQHGYQEWFQIQLFYNGLNGQTRTIMHAAASGTLLSKTTEDAFRLLEEMSTNNCQWPEERSKKAARIHEVDPIISLQPKSRPQQTRQLPSPQRCSQQRVNHGLCFFPEYGGGCYGSRAMLVCEQSEL